MNFNPIIKGITTGLGILSSLSGAQKTSQADASVTGSAATKDKSRSEDMVARIQQAAQAMGVEAQALQQALANARQDASGSAAQMLDGVARKLGVSTSSLKQALMNAQVKTVDATV